MGSSIADTKQVPGFQASLGDRSCRANLRWVGRAAVGWSTGSVSIVHGLHIPTVLMVTHTGHRMAFKAATSEGTEGRKKVCGTGGLQQ